MAILQPLHSQLLPLLPQNQAAPRPLAQEVLLLLRHSQVLLQPLLLRLLLLEPLFLRSRQQQPRLAVLLLQSKLPQLSPMLPRSSKHLFPHQNPRSPLRQLLLLSVV